MTEQLTAADVARLRAEGRDQEIVDAHNDGRLDLILGVPSEDVALIDRAQTGQILDLNEVRALARLNRHDLIDNAVIRTTTPNQEK